LKNFSLCKRAHNGFWNDVQEKIDHVVVRLSLLQSGSDVGFAQRGNIHIHASAGLKNRGNYPPDDQGNGRHYLEIDKSLYTDAAKTLQIPHARDAGHDSGENDRRDHHANEPNEGVAKRLEICARESVTASEKVKSQRSFFRKKVSHEDPQQHSDEDPKVELLINSLAHVAGRLYGRVKLA
jgi:hypothetical protein